MGRTKKPIQKLEPEPEPESEPEQQSLPQPSHDSTHYWPPRR